MANSTFMSLTKQDIQTLKSMIRTGEPILQIAKRMAPQYNRTPQSFAVTLYNLAKQTRKIAEWTGPKRQRRKSTNQNRPMPNTSTPVRVEKYADHVRVYF